MYDHLRNGNYDACAITSGWGPGQQEILNWMCLVAAMSALDRKPKETGVVDTWIFNSLKTFLIAPPN
jgi:hypothetical protein